MVVNVNNKQIMIYLKVRDSPNLLLEEEHVQKSMDSLFPTMQATAFFPLDYLKE